MIASVKVLATAHASAVGGRNGHSETPDRLISVDLSVPKEMGGPGKPGTVTPEHLFAAGYAACFGGAIEFVAQLPKTETGKLQRFALRQIAQAGAASRGLAAE